MCCEGALGRGRGIASAIRRGARDAAWATSRRYGATPGAALASTARGRPAARRSAGETVASRAIIVHAKHERVRGFYETFGFRTFADNPLHLYLPMKAARALVERLPASDS